MTAEAPRLDSERKVDLGALFNPASVAVVGATEGFTKVGGRTLTSLIANDFQGRIYPINPGRDIVQGLRSYPAMDAAPEAPELAILCVPVSEIENQVAMACRIGVRALIIFSSGFAEVDAEGAERQQRIADMVRAHDIVLIGPNCLGVINGTTGLAASSTVMLKDRKVTPSGLSFVSQSGAIATFWMDAIFNAGIGIGKWVSTGNEAALGLSEVVDYLVDDPDTQVIGLYVEGFRDGRILRRALARAAAARKPVIVLKSGRSDAGAQATASHTGALSGEDSLNSALLEQYGACQAESLTELIQLSRLFLTQTPDTGNRAGVISLSGGAGALMTDAVAKQGFELPPLSARVIEKLQPHFPSYIKLGNPIDLSDRIIIEPEMFELSVKAMMESGDYDVIFTFMAGRTPILLEKTEEAAKRVFPAWQGSYANVWLATDPAMVERLRADNILVFDEITDAVDIVAKSVRMARAWESIPQGSAPAIWSGSDSTPLTERASKALLAERVGLASPSGVMVNDNHQVGCALKLEPGQRVVVKLQSTELLHKSGYGAIEIGLDSIEAVTRSVAQMCGMADEKRIPIEGVLIEHMEQIEHEFLVGLRHDPVLGPYLVIGRGGVTVELDPDVVQRFLPLSADDVAGMFRSLRCNRLLDGFRGKPAVPLAELSSVIADLSAAFAGSDDLAEIEINPLCVLKDGRIVAIDAAVRLRAN